MDTFNLSKWGFTVIRNLLEGRVQGGEYAAKELAEALHNLPEPDNNFCENMTRERLMKFMAKYPALSKEMPEFF